MRYHDYEQRKWAIDIERHDRMRRIMETTKTNAVREIALRNMQEIESRYPSHFKKVTQP